MTSTVTSWGGFVRKEVGGWVWEEEEVEQWIGRYEGLELERDRDKDLRLLSFDLEGWREWEGGRDRGEGEGRVRERGRREEKDIGGECGGASLDGLVRWFAGICGSRRALEVGE